MAFKAGFKALDRGQSRAKEIPRRKFPPKQPARRLEAESSKFGMKSFSWEEEKTKPRKKIFR
jgi:hypothetical protein